MGLVKLILHFWFFLSLTNIIWRYPLNKSGCDIEWKKHDHFAYIEYTVSFQKRFWYFCKQRKHGMLLNLSSWLEGNSLILIGSVTGNRRSNLNVGRWFSFFSISFLITLTTHSNKKIAMCSIQFNKKEGWK